MSSPVEQMENVEYGKPDPNRRTIKLFEEYDALYEKQQYDVDMNKPMELLEQSEMFEIYCPATMEIISIAKEAGDVLSDQSLDFLDQALKNAVIPQGYSPQGSDALSTVKNVASVTKDFLDAGKIIFETFPKYLQIFGPLGSLIKDIIDIAKPEKKDPVLEELGNLKGQLQSLSQKMTVQFDELKSFMVENDFYNKYAHKASLLFEYMMDCASVDKKAQERFEECYKEMKPERYVTEMMIKLESDVTNPLKVIMAGDELTSKATFEKWKSVLASTLAQFLMLECFAMGLLHPKDESDCNKIMEKLTYYSTLVKQWEKHYLNDRPYWSNLKNYVKRIQGEGTFDKDEDMADALLKGFETIFTKEFNSFNKDEDMADALLKGFETIFTNDNFYICVFDRNVHCDYHTVKPEMLFVSTNNGKFNVIISRAFEHNESTCLQYGDILDNNRDRKTSGGNLLHTLTTLMKEYLRSAVISSAKNEFKGCSYFLAVTSRDVAVRWTKKNGARKGPGTFNWHGQLTVVNLFYAKWYMLYMVGE